MTETYQSALIVGAGSGLSASVARAFAQAGMKIALAARSTDDLAALAKETNAKTYACDAGERAQVDKLFAALDADGAPDVVVYNASYRTRGPLLELDPGRGGEGAARLRLRRLPGGAGRGQAHAAARARRRAVHRRLRQHQGLCAVGALRHGQVRAARPGAEHGARTGAAGHPRRALRDRWRHPQPAPRRSRPTSRIRCSIPTPSRRPICTSCSSRAAPGPGRSSCGPGWRSSSQDFGKGRSNLVSLSPCGRGWLARREFEREPGRGPTFSAALTPHPASCSLRSQAATLSHKGRGLRRALPRGHHRSYVVRLRFPAAAIPTARASA